MKNCSCNRIIGVPHWKQRPRFSEDLNLTNFGLNIVAIHSMAHKPKKKLWGNSVKIFGDLPYVASIAASYVLLVSTFCDIESTKYIKRTIREESQHYSRSNRYTDHAGHMTTLCLLTFLRHGSTRIWTQYGATYTIQIIPLALDDKFENTQF